MIFRRLEMEDFGIFYGSQSLDLKPGLYVLHGENGRGKTTIINAVKWVLFGGFDDRQGRPVDPRGVLNLDAKAEGVERFSVTLTLEDDGVTTLARRTCERLGGGSPESSLYVERGGQPLNQAEAEHTLRNFLEENVARFFLFDGEQLREYEELLFDDNESALVKRSIEQILGLPVLEHAIADVRTVKSEVEKKIAKIARKDAKTEQLSHQVAQLETEIAEAEKDRQDLGALKAEQEAKAKEAAVILQENEASRELVKKLETVEFELETLGTSKDEREEDRAAALGSAWKDALAIAVSPRRQSLNDEVEERAAAERRAIGVAQIERSLSDGSCDLCGQEIGDDVGAHLRADLAGLGPLAGDDGAVDPRGALAALAAIVDTGALEQAVKYDERVSEAETSIASKKQELEQIRESLGSAPATDIRVAGEHYDKAMLEAGSLQGKIEEKDEAIAGKEQQRQSIVKEISDSSDDSEMDGLKQSEKLAIDLIGLFEQARDGFRDDLRTEVEKDASEIFAELTTEPDHSGLRITDSYGLETLGPDGEPVPSRSAGQEQVVAMALIGALNRNAARQAPVMMDTPFARLDKTHRGNVLAFLSKMADQVFLLVHSAEIGPGDLVGVASEIKEELMLKRVSAFSTEILPHVEGE